MGSLTLAYPSIAGKTTQEQLESMRRYLCSVTEQLNLADWSAQAALQENAALSPADRAAEAILAACRWLSETQALVFIENDAEFLLRRLPGQVKTAHYHDDETHIRALLEESGLQPRGGIALAAAAIRGLILTVSHQEQIGALYPQVLETLVRGACREL